MFGGKKQEHSDMKKPIPVDKADIKAFLGAGSKFEGKLSFDEMVRIDGGFAGEINSSDTLVVGETATIEGIINVGSLILSGKFDGDIKASIMVELKAPALVTGSIDTPSLRIDEKVIFNGEIKMSGGNSSAQADKNRKTEKK